jgi:F-type H+-transporting ATPase subunit delta
MRSARQTRRDAKRLYRLCLVNGLLDPARTQQIVQKVIATKRRNSLMLLSYFQHLVKLDSARNTAEIESAAPVPEDLRASIQSDLVRIYGPGIRTSFIHNPTLIGGMRIKVGSDVYDGSVQAGLAALRKSF